jgi:hypothetical protein
MALLATMNWRLIHPGTFTAPLPTEEMIHPAAVVLYFA